VAETSGVPARLLYAVVGRGTLDAGLAALGATPFRAPVPDELPSVPDAVVTTRLDVRDQHARRIAAMRAHATQVVVAPDERSFALSNGVAQPILPVEEYVAVDGRPTAGLFEDGLFGDDDG
jgi:N-acetyl-1-D-myo-inositol-2-amino-2-deoxy-alpha-D-glucopyranoside deacetylase